MEETKKAEAKEQKGYYLGEVPTGFQPVIAKDGAEVNVMELLVKIANACEKAGLLV